MIVKDTAMHNHFRAINFFLLISYLNYPAYGCTLNGIDIQKTLSTIIKQSSGVDKAKSSAQQDKKGEIGLVEILGDLEYRDTVLASVQVRLDSAEAGDFYDTDEEKKGASRKRQTIQKMTMNKVVLISRPSRSLGLAAKGNRDRERCLLTREDWQHNPELPEENTKQLCENLALDAYEIANITGEGEDYTCLCILLRDEKNYVHKVVFHNVRGQLPTKMREKYSDLSYSGKNLRGGHAEVQFISYLLMRMEQNKPPMAYDHIIGMGCSRKNCPNCAALLIFFLGKEYASFHAYASEEKCTGGNISMERKEIDGRTKIVKTIPEQIDHIEAMYPGSEIGNYSPNDYLLSEIIGKKLSTVAGINFGVE